MRQWENKKKSPTTENEKTTYKNLWSAAKAVWKVYSNKYKYHHPKDMKKHNSMH